MFGRNMRWWWWLPYRRYAQWILLCIAHKIFDSTVHSCSLGHGSEFIGIYVNHWMRLQWSIHLITKMQIFERLIGRRWNDCRTNVTLSQTWKMKNNNEWKLNSRHSQGLRARHCWQRLPITSPPPFSPTNCVISLRHCALREREQVAIAPSDGCNCRTIIVSVFIVYLLWLRAFNCFFCLFFSAADSCSIGQHSSNALTGKRTFSICVT